MLSHTTVDLKIARNWACRQARAAGDARTWVASAPTSSARTAEERVGPRGSRRAESDLAVGHDQDLGGSGRGLGVPGVRDRLLHAGDRGLEFLASLPDRRRVAEGLVSVKSKLTSDGARYAPGKAKSIAIVLLWKIRNPKVRLAKRSSQGNRLSSCGSNV
jgi:hypothetical protein